MKKILSILLIGILILSTTACGSSTNEKDFTNEEVTEENVKVIVDDIIKKGVEEVKVITIEESFNISITYSDNEPLTTEGLVKDNANNTAVLMEKLFKNPKVNMIYVFTKTDMIDPKGNVKNDNIIKIGISKENVKDINWEKFKDMVLLDYKKLHNIADDLYIHPGIAKEL